MRARRSQSDSLKALEIAAQNLLEVAMQGSLESWASECRMHGDFNRASGDLVQQMRMLEQMPAHYSFPQPARRPISRAA